MVTFDSAKYQSGIIHDIEMSCECVVILQKRYIFMHDLAPCQNSKSNRIFPDCNGISILELTGNSPDMNPIENVWNLMKKEIGNQIPCKIVEMWKRVCEAWYSVALNVLEELNTPIPRRIADLIKQMEIQRNTDFMV